MHRFKTVIGFLTFGLAVAAIIVLLKIMNVLPLTVQHNTLRQYESIEQVRSMLNIRDIYIPSYFPEEIRWPPSKILAQDKPFQALLMEFKRAGKDEVVLVLSQSRGGTLKSENSLEPSAIKETVPFLLRDSTVVLTVGECEDRKPCSMITWNEGGYLISASMRSAPFELTKIVASMHP
jgi:hypothetical protein